MADFRSVVEDVFRVSVPQADLDVKNGRVVLDHVDDEMRGVIEAELRRVPVLVEEGVETVERGLERLARAVDQKALELAAAVSDDKNNDSEQDAPKGDD